MPTPRRLHRLNQTRSTSRGKENPSFAASVETEHLDIAAIVVHVIDDDDRRWIGNLLISQLNHEPPRSFTIPIRLDEAHNPNAAVKKLASYYQEHPEEVMLPDDAELTNEQIVQIMGQIAQAAIRRLI